MSSHSVKLTQPFFRHFVPLAEDILVHTPQKQVFNPFVINLSKWLVQGAVPLDPSLISKADNHTAKQFQGGYVCTIQIVSQPAHGIAVISDDRMGIAYIPKLTYKGPDAIGYRIVNVMGQPSDVHCISLYVRT
jgi:hypothetical protein